MKKIYLSMLVVAAFMFAACDPNGQNPEDPTKKPDPNALTEKVDPTKEDFSRKVLIEQFTSQACGACPSGAQVIKNVIAGNEDKVVWVSHHAGYATDDFTIAKSESIAGQFGVSGAPNMMLNRDVQTYHDFSIDNLGQPIIGQEMSSLVFHPAYLQEGGISTMFQDALKVEGLASINIKQRMEGGKLKVGVYGAVKDLEKIRLNVMLVENNIKAKQYGPLNSTGSQYGYNNEYIHNNVPREIVTVALGDDIILDAATYEKEYEFSPKSSWKLENCEIVAFVTKSTVKTVLNAASVPVQQ